MFKVTKVTLTNPLCYLLADLLFVLHAPPRGDVAWILLLEREPFFEEAVLRLLFICLYPFIRYFARKTGLKETPHREDICPIRLLMLGTLYQFFWWGSFEVSSLPRLKSSTLNT